MIAYISIFLFSIAVTFIFSHFLIPRLKRFGIIGKDVNKPGNPEVAEMGGFAIVAGFSAGVFLAVFFNTFFGFHFNLIFILASLLTVYVISFIGILDDLLDIPQWLKAIVPLFAAVPLIAVEAVGNTSMFIPFFGEIEFGIFYILLLIPLGVAVSSNLTNMLAGFNGMEAGMGIVIFSFASILAYISGNTEPLILFIPIIGALLAFSYFNWYPAKVFPGDIGNLTIGGILACGVIIGNMESIGAMLLILYVLDFFIKLYNKFPSKNWWGEYRDGKLYPPENKVRGLAQFIMKKFNGISEKNLTLVFIFLQIFVGLFVLSYFLYFKTFF
ncbi:MAG: hypothetical protein WC501_03920 [Candidatus Micrarchaeia archaeon]